MEQAAGTPTRLTVLLGGPAPKAPGEQRPDDLVVDLAGEPATVQAVLVDGPDGQVRLPWSAVGRDAHGLTVVPAGAEPAYVGEHEVLLRRDVLDAPVYDGPHRRLARVGEVWLARTGEDRLEVWGLETGARPVLRRLGIVRDHAPDRQHLLALEATPLLTVTGHHVQQRLPSPPSSRFDEEETAYLLSHLPGEHLADVVGSLGEQRASGVLARLHPRVRRRVHRAVHGTDPRRRRFLRTAGWRSFPPRSRGDRS